MMVTRVDRIELMIIQTTYDAQGRPIDERRIHAANGGPLTVLRAATPDVWAAVDAAVAQYQAEEAAEDRPAPALRVVPRTEAAPR